MIETNRDAGVEPETDEDAGEFVDMGDCAPLRIIGRTAGGWPLPAVRVSSLVPLNPLGPQRWARTDSMPVPRCADGQGGVSCMDAPAGRLVCPSCSTVTVLEAPGHPGPRLPVCECAGVDVAVCAHPPPPPRPRGRAAPGVPPSSRPGRRAR